MLDCCTYRYSNCVLNNVRCTDCVTSYMSSAKTGGVDGIVAPASGLELKMMRALRSTISTITKETDGAHRIAGAHFLDGSFRKLCHQASFSELLFPGLSAGLRSHMPKDLKEVLEWDGLDIDLRTVARSACEVLENVKLKGTAGGDVMDAESEAVLLPQIAQEALANGIVRAVRNLGRRVSHMNAKTSQPIASTSAPQAHLDQLESTLLEELLSTNRTGVQRDYLGEEWSGLVRADMERFVREETMSAVDCNGGVVVQREDMVSTCSTSDTTPFGRIAWLAGSGGWSDTCPALSEAVTQLHALPFEINRKLTQPLFVIFFVLTNEKMFIGEVVKLDSRPGWDLQLLEPSRASTMLVHVPAGARQTARFDSRSDGGDLDSGFRYAATTWAQ